MEIAVSLAKLAGISDIPNTWLIIIF